MDVHSIPKIVLIVVFLLVLHPSGSRSQWSGNQPSPLCPSQLALVNHACSLLPFLPVNTPSPPSSVPLSLVHPAPPTPPERRHRHRHARHHEDYMQTPVEENCCKWMKQVDSVCVCDVLVRLPLFLSRPIHHYTITIDPACNITFDCSSRTRSPSQMLPPFP